MDKRQKFENFLESLKGNGHDVLIESIKKGFQVINEGNADFKIDAKRNIAHSLSRKEEKAQKKSREAKTRQAAKKQENLD